MKRLTHRTTDAPPVHRPPLPAKSELAWRVRRFLHDRVPGLDGLAVESDGGTVVLRGRVPSPQTRRLSVECCRHVAGVIHVIDELEVADAKWERYPR